MNYFFLIACAALATVSASAQAPVKYRFTMSHGTKLDQVLLKPTIDSLKASGASAGTIGRMTGDRLQTGSAVISVTTRDSAGGMVWQIVIDSFIQKSDSSQIASAAKRGQPFVPPPADIFRVFVKDGNPLTLYRGNRNWPQFPASHPIAELLDKMPGYGLVLPLRDIPTRIAETRVDTLFDELPRDIKASAPGRQSWMVVNWKRQSRDSVIAQMDSRMILEPGSQVIDWAATDSLRIVYDAAQVVREIRTWGTAGMTGTAANKYPTVGTTTFWYALTRIP